MRSGLSIASLVASSAFLVRAAAGQCDQWIPTLGSSEFANAVKLCVVDHDGAGPQPPRLYATGYLVWPGNVSRYLHWWDGTSWTPVLQWNVNGTPTALFALDQDAGGLSAGTLLIGGSASSGATGGARFFSAWDGQNLVTIGPSDGAAYSTNAVINAITLWDPDGPGPLPPLIVVGGSFTMIGGVSASRVAAWDGTQWLALGAGRPTTVNALVSFDPDGPGPALPLLIANSAAWNGSTWQTLGALTGTVNTLAVHDPDGDGPAPAQLYAGGNFTPLPSVVVWNGSAWAAAGTGNVGNPVNDLRSIDLDGPGPQPPLLYAAQSAGGPIPPMAVLANGAWTTAPGITSSGSGRWLAVFDPDGSGPRGAEVIVATTAPSGAVGATSFLGPYAWDGQRWAPLGDEIAGGVVQCFAWFDDDGDGPDAPALYASGSFTYAGGVPADGLARWDGQRWLGLGTPSASAIKTILRIASFDPDGSGTQAPMLVGIDARSSAPHPALRWNGTAWVAVGAGTLSAFQLTSMCVMDDDGAGPHGTTLFVGGTTVHDNGTGNGDVASYVSGNFFGIISPGSYGTLALVEHDPDGPGPQPSALYRLTNGFDGLTRWNGAAWSTVSQMSFDNMQFIPGAISWTPSAARPPELVLGATSVFAGGRSLFGPCAFDGTGWRQLGDTQRWIIRSLASYDPDGSGPLPPQLVMGWRNDNGSNFRAVQRLSGDTWTDLGTGLADANSPQTCAANAMVTVDPDGPGPLPPELWIGGSFTHASGAPARNFARWRLAGEVPLITQQPQPAGPCSNEPAMLTVAASGAGLNYRWRIQDPSTATTWRDVADGPLLIGGQQVGVAAGSNLSTLTFSPAVGVSASFTCVVRGACAAAITDPALVTATLCCGSADFNHDGDAGTDADIEAFFACLAGNCCPTCDSADFNADGDTGTDADIEAFFRVLAGGTC